MRVKIVETKRGSIRLEIGYAINIYVDSTKELVELSSKINKEIGEFIKKKYSLKKS